MANFFSLNGVAPCARPVYVNYEPQDEFGKNRIRHVLDRTNAVTFIAEPKMMNSHGRGERPQLLLWNFCHASGDQRPVEWIFPL
jgi:hypothetical protein